jgi:branched-chain amino acid transport system permease protein
VSRRKFKSLRQRRVDGGRPFIRWRKPFGDSTVFGRRAYVNPRTLRREREFVDERPIWWTVAIVALAVIPALRGSNTLLGSVGIFGIYAAINLMWILVIGTAGIFSLATLAIVGAAAYIASWLSIKFGVPWPVMLIIGTGVGLVFGFVLALPAMRLDRMYYALLTLGIVELCRVYVVQSSTFGSATGGLYGADTFVPAGVGYRSGLVISYLAALGLMAVMLVIHYVVDGRRLGLLLRTARETEVAAEAIGINLLRIRIQVFMISSGALGFIGGFYAAYFKGASPSLFSTDTLLVLFAMIVIGGMGSAEGAVIGTAIVVYLNNARVSLGPPRIIAIGGIMAVTALLTREGLYGIPAQYRAWRDKRKTERMATRSEKDGEISPELAALVEDKQSIYFSRFRKQLRERLKDMATPEVIEEHRRNPLGQHSDSLDRILNYFRRAPLPDKYIIVTVDSFQAYKVVALSGVRGIPPREVDDRIYPSLDEAYHAVFLRRLNDLMES